MCTRAYRGRKDVRYHLLEVVYGGLHLRAVGNIVLNSVNEDGLWDSARIRWNVSEVNRGVGCRVHTLGVAIYCVSCVHRSN